ncbi:MAG: KaiC domain-containing protein [Thermoproteota archaeon]|nr:MAG: KaiC domain-containing protein [Candidatus Korarchaeota archaeon]
MLALPKAFEDAIELAEEAGKRAPKLFGVPSGVEGLDDLFYKVEFTDEGVRRVPLGGYPYRAVMNITGVPDTGKSLMAEQFAVKQASLGYTTCFVTVESPSSFLARGLMQRSAAMGIGWEFVKRRIVIIDAASHKELREDLPTLLETIAFAIREYDVKSVTIDSITGLFEAREVLARSVVREVFNFLKSWGQTAILISQKRSGHREESAEAAGGYAVSHIVDGTIVLGKILVRNRWEENLYNKPIGTLIRTIRIDGCRMVGHDTSTHLLFITDEGLVKVGPRLEELRG